MAITDQRTVYYRKYDGRGTATYGRYTTDAAALKGRDQCFRTIPDASMVWVVKEGCSGSVGDVLIRDE